MTTAAVTLERILPALAASAGFFLALLAAAWTVERVCGLHRTLPPCRTRRARDARLLGATLAMAVPLTVVTLLLASLCRALAVRLGCDLPDQTLILVLRDAATPTEVRWAIGLFALLEAPLLEEALFRRFLFRNLLRATALKPAGAMLLSGALFALVHLNAVTFAPLWFFGAALARAYYRTGRLIVPMAIHFLFNLVNLLLLFLLPDWA